MDILAMAKAEQDNLTAWRRHLHAHPEPSGQEEASKNYSGWWPGKPEPRKLGYRAFPESAQEELKKERKSGCMR